MLLKIVSIFLLGMAVLAIFGRLRFPRGIAALRKPKAMAKPATCIRCGRYVIGKGGCDCGGRPPAPGA